MKTPAAPFVTTDVTPSAAVRTIVRQALHAWHRLGDRRYLAVARAFDSPPPRPTPGASRRQAVNVATPSSSGFNDGGKAANANDDNDVEADDRR